MTTRFSDSLVSIKTIKPKINNLNFQLLSIQLYRILLVFFRFCLDVAIKSSKVKRQIKTKAFCIA